MLPQSGDDSCDMRRLPGATIDLIHAGEDRDRKVTCPLLVLWGGERSTTGQLNDVMKIWRDHATDVRGKALPGGHFLPEEMPDEMLDAMLSFFTA